MCGSPVHLRSTLDQPDAANRAEENGEKHKHEDDEDQNAYQQGNLPIS
jgi:hypothetical protein